ncbi:MAG: hypothetical protein RLO01_12660 [Thalassobaculaceae bacterium]
MTDAGLLNVTLADQAAWARAFRDAPEAALEEMVTATVEASLLVEREAAENTPVGIGGGGGLKGAWSYREPDILGDRVIGEVGNPLNYAVPVELGSKPHFPPIEPLKDWVRQKLDVELDEVDDVARMIQRKIGAHGTDGKFMLTAAIVKTEAQIREIYGAALARVGERVGPGTGGRA